VSPQLECLTLNNIIDLDKAFIITPNLRKFNLINTFKFQTLCPIVGSRHMEVEMGARATNSLLELRTFAENLGENITLSLETDTTGAKVCTYIFSIFQFDFLSCLTSHFALNIIFRCV